MEKKITLLGPIVVIRRTRILIENHDVLHFKHTELGFTYKQYPVFSIFMSTQFNFLAFATLENPFTSSATPFYLYRSSHVFYCCSSGNFQQIFLRSRPIQLGLMWLPQVFFCSAFQLIFCIIFSSPNRTINFVYFSNKYSHQMFFE